MLFRSLCKGGLAIGILALVPALAQTPPGGRGGQPTQPAGAWMNKALSPDERADMVIKEMTIDEKLQLVHGGGSGNNPASGGAQQSRSNGGAGFVPGIPRLGIPDINMADSTVGVTRGAAMGRYSTLLPSTLGAASSWDLDAAFLYGTVIGRELRAQGYNMSIGGGESKTVMIAIDPLYLSVFDEAKDAWNLLFGEYKLMAGASSRTLPLAASVQIAQ